MKYKRELIFILGGILLNFILLNLEVNVLKVSETYYTLLMLPFFVLYAFYLGGQFPKKRVFTTSVIMGIAFCLISLIGGISDTGAINPINALTYGLIGIAIGALGAFLRSLAKTKNKMIGVVLGLLLIVGVMYWQSKTGLMTSKPDVLKVPASKFAESNKLLSMLKEDAQTISGISNQFKMSTDDFYYRTEDKYDVVIRKAPNLLVVVKRSQFQTLTSRADNILRKAGFQKTSFGPSIHYLVEDELQGNSDNSQEIRYAQYEKGSTGCLVILSKDSGVQSGSSSLELSCVDNLDQIANFYKPFLKASLEHGEQLNPTNPPSWYETIVTSDIYVKDEYFSFYGQSSHMYGKYVNGKPLILADTQDDLLCDFVDKEKIPVGIYGNCYTDPDGLKLRFNK